MNKSAFNKLFGFFPEYIMLFPVFLMVGGFALPYHMVLFYTLSMPLHVIVGRVLISAVKKYKNIFAVILGLLYKIIFLVVVETLFNLDLLHFIIFSASVFAVYAWGIWPMVSKRDGFRMSYFGGLFIYIIGMFFFLHAPLLMPWRGWFSASAILFTLSGLPISNQKQLNHEIIDKKLLTAIPASVRKGNVITTVSMVLVIVIFSFWKTLASVVKGIANAILSVLAGIFELLSSLMKPVQVENNGQPQDPLEGLRVDEQETSLFWDILYWVMLAAIIGCAVLLLVKNHKKILNALSRWFSKLFDRIKGWGGAELGYVDRQESLLKKEEETPRRKGGFISRLFARPVQWRDLKDNISRVRYIYSKVVRDNIRAGYAYTPSKTPNETLDGIRRIDGKIGQERYEQLAESYNQARYGNEAIGDDLVDKLKQEFI